jgi:hypothetical protein
MAGLIATMNGKSEMQKSSTDFTRRLKRWVAMFAETFQRNTSLSELQTKSYEMALCDLSVAELDAACEKTLRTWTLATMPPPGFIRECLPQDARRVASDQWLASQPSDEELHRRGLEYCARTKEFTLTIVDMSKTYVKPEPFVCRVNLEARREELDRQKEVLKSRGLWKE